MACAASHLGCSTEPSSEAADSSGASSGSIPTTGGGDAVETTGSTRVGDTESSAGTTSPSPSGVYCEAAAQYAKQCGASISTCERDALVRCVEADIERGEYLEARADCGLPEMCGVGAEVQMCVYENTPDLQPTDTQGDLAQALCTACYPQDDACFDGFFLRPDLGMVVPLGLAFLRFTDAFVDTLLVECAPSIGPSCVQTFLNCLDDEVDALQPQVAQACEGPSPV